MILKTDIDLFQNLLLKTAYRLKFSGAINHIYNGNKKPALSKGVSSKFTKI
jgi:hypothetical protein